MSRNITIASTFYLFSLPFVNDYLGFRNVHSEIERCKIERVVDAKENLFYLFSDESVLILSGFPEFFRDWGALMLRHEMKSKYHPFR